jgi:hypothetical protein
MIDEWETDRIILKWIIMTWDGKVLTGTDWPGIGSYTVLLRIC